MSRDDRKSIGAGVPDLATRALASKYDASQHVRERGSDDPLRVGARDRGPCHGQFAIPSPDWSVLADDWQLRFKHNLFHDIFLFMTLQLNHFIYLK
ncbi:hypothetical protein FHR22_001350 [Sphingopyxis panaciterrae]|uniref:hypothetical protein n=1 Tax=Sphingopyxis panaciterrae TaxID=363841 RepID=UPI001421935C|nr:hypothetical protein [Sphingopyxis panaciterrae]NIJ36701.1 hypothetical protein [Sphingopyxis panaciterrae]